MKILVVGAGSIGRRHLGNLKNLGEKDLLVMDPSQERRDKAVQDFDAQGFASLEQALAQKPGAVLVCSPNSLHVTQAMESIRAGCHTFVEKPLSHNSDGVDSLVREAEERSLVTMVGSNFKFHPLFLKMKEILESGVLGRITSARCQFGQYLPDWHPYEDFRQGYSARQDLGGGVLLDSHELAYMIWFLGDVDQVFCFSGKLSSLEIQTEDTAAVLLRFASGTIGEVHLDYTQRVYQRNYEFFGEQGTMTWDYSQGKVRLYLASEKSWTEFEQPGDYDINQMYVAEIDHFRFCAKTGKKTITDFMAGQNILEVILAAKTSSREGRIIKPQEGTHP
ncbi:MAG: Gfo/Idh/MocA family oxidoreductase [Desulfatibacillum sp.]|nr:Gfo/Idh/MocA family oxidoreductase [Desulfatibacillum sp.]